MHAEAMPDGDRAVEKNTVTRARARNKETIWRERIRKKNSCCHKSTTAANNSAGSSSDFRSVQNYGSACLRSVICVEQSAGQLNVEHSACTMCASMERQLYSLLKTW